MITKSEGIIFQIREKTENGKIIPIVKKYANGKIEVFGKETITDVGNLIKKIGVA